MSSTLRSLTPPRALAIAALAALACVLLATPPRAHAARGMEIAVQDDPVFVQQAYYDRERALQQAQALGVTRIRVNLGWAQALGGRANLRLAPSAPTYNFANADGLIDAAARYGIRIQLTLTGKAPAFATGNRRVGVVQPDGKQFYKFASAAAQHFRGRVDRYSIWNEPNYTGWIYPLRQQPQIYRSLYINGYNAIKRADPRAKVFIGETVPYSIRRVAQSPISFLRAVTCVDGSYHHVRGCTGPKTLHADGYAHHPYEFKHAPNYRYPGQDNATTGTLKNLTRALDKLKKARVLKPTHGSHMPLYLTEYGYFASGKRKVAESKRATWLRQAFAIGQKNGRVKEMLQYLLVHPPSTFKGDYFFDLSVLSTDGDPSDTFTSLLSWTQQAAAKRQIALARAPIVLPPAPPGSSPAPRR
jgi:hypothetical protein